MYTLSVTHHILYNSYIITIATAQYYPTEAMHQSKILSEYRAGSGKTELGGLLSLQCYVMLYATSTVCTSSIEHQHLTVK